LDSFWSREIPFLLFPFLNETPGLRPDFSVQSPGAAWQKASFEALSEELPLLPFLFPLSLFSTLPPILEKS